MERPLDRIVHTMGWPLPGDAFGGSFMYPMADDLVALGLVVGLDYGDARFDVHEALQRLKLHPLVRPYLEGGEMVEWGAKTIPEGGYYSVPERRHGDGLVVVGDAAGYVEVSSLKGIHYAMHSGILAARQIFSALKAGDTSEAGLAGYTAAVDAGLIMRDLKERRNMRLAFKSGFVSGGVKAGLMTLTRGAFPGGQVRVEEDAAHEKTFGPEPEPFAPDGDADLLEGRRGLQVGEPDPRRHPLAPDPRRRRERGGRGALRAHVSRGGLRAERRPARGQRPELRRLQGDRRAGSAVDSAGGRQRSGVPPDVTDGPTMDTPGTLFLHTARHYLSGEYLPKIRRCLETLPEEDLWWRPNAESNSVGNLVLHLCGNVRQWVVSGVGGRADVRERAKEFAADGGYDGVAMGKAELVRRLEETLAEVDEVLAGCSVEELTRTSVFQGNEITVLEGVFHAVEHFSMHTGQIVYVTKLRTGRDLRFYQVEDGVARPDW